MFNQSEQAWTNVHQSQPSISNTHCVTDIQILTGFCRMAARLMENECINSRTVVLLRQNCLGIEVELKHEVKSEREAYEITCRRTKC